MILFLLLCFLFATPMLNYARDHKTDFNRRWLQVSSFHQPEPLKTVVKTTLKTCLMVNFKGCFYKKYNVPDQPVLPHALSLFFPLGLIVVIRSSRKDPGMILLLAWLFFGFLPGMITWPAPWFSRPILALPAIMIITAVGVKRFAESLSGIQLYAGFRRLVPVVVSLVVILLTAWAYHSIFSEWASVIKPIEKSGAIMVCHIE